MAIGPDGRIIRRNVRRFTPVNTDHPAEETGFLIGFISVMILSVLVVLIFVLLGWAGDFFIQWSWWNASNFLTAGFVINLLIFPVYISGALEGLTVHHFSRYRRYAFFYGLLAMAMLIGISQLSEGGFNHWTYLWAVGYGIYTVWLATKMAD